MPEHMRVATVNGVGTVWAIDYILTGVVDDDTYEVSVGSGGSGQIHKATLPGTPAGWIAALAYVGAETAAEIQENTPR